MSNAKRTLLGSTRTALMSGSDVDGRGLGLSFLLHAGVMALIIIGPPSLGRDLGPVAPPVPIEVIDFDTFTRLANNDPTEELAEEPQLAVNQPEPEPTLEPPPVEQAPAQPEVPVTPPAPPPPTPEPIVEPAPEPVPEPIPAPEPPPEAPAEPEPAPSPPTPVPRSKPTPPPPPPTPQAEAPESEPEAPSRQDFLASVLRNLDDSEPQPRSDEAIAEQLQRNRAEATASSISVVTRGTSDRLTASQADALRRHVGQFWNIDAGAQGIADMVAVVEITLNQQREVVRVQLLEDQARYNRDGFYRSFTERAMRAVKQASPLLPLPLDGYQSWRTTIITFSPRDMF